MTYHQPFQKPFRIPFIHSFGNRSLENSSQRTNDGQQWQSFKLPPRGITLVGFQRLERKWFFCQDFPLFPCNSSSPLTYSCIFGWRIIIVVDGDVSLLMDEGLYLLCECDWFIFCAKWFLFCAKYAGFLLLAAVFCT